jgi:hypothetical protein
MACLMFKTRLTVTFDNNNNNNNNGDDDYDNDKIRTFVVILC